MAQFPYAFWRMVGLWVWVVLPGSVEVDLSETYRLRNHLGAATRAISGLSGQYFKLFTKMCMGIRQDFHILLIDNGWQGNFVKPMGSCYHTLSKSEFTQVILVGPLLLHGRSSVQFPSPFRKYSIFSEQTKLFWVEEIVLLFSENNSRTMAKYILLSLNTIWSL